MSGASYILGINLLVAGLFSASFVLIAFYSRFQSPWWFAAGYASGMVYLALEALLPVFENGKVVAFFGAVSFLAALFLLNIGLTLRYSVNAPRVVLAGTLGLSMLVFALTLEMPRASILRQFLYQMPFAAMQAIGAWIIFKSDRKRLAEQALGGFLALSALHFLSKPLLAMAVGGTGANAQAYIGTTYAMLSQSMGVVLSVATALLLLAMLIADILKDITAKSETDLLSGLLNRRGFQQRLVDIGRSRSANGMPIALIISDLDHFKTVNDTYGHAVGDRVIAAFAATLRSNAAPHHVLGRVGGEEFAIILPGSNLAAGRLFAESVRASFSGTQLDGVPLQFSASFGVAEMSVIENADAFMARADAALYEAKRSGRDCVRVSRAQPVNAGDYRKPGNDVSGSQPWRRQ